jgi:hypothetical protein
MIAVFVGCLGVALHSWRKGRTRDALSMLGLALIVAARWSPGIGFAGVVLIVAVFALDLRRWIRKRRDRP